MSDYVTFRDAKPATVSHTLFLALKAKDGQTTAELAAGVAMSSKHCSALLGAMLRRGWISRTITINRAGRGCPKLARWFLTEKGRTGERTPLPYHNTPALITAALVNGPVRVRVLADTIGRPYRTLLHAVRRMQERNEVETFTERNCLYVRLPLGDDAEDEAWTPQPWVSSIRARALGLPSAMRRVA